MICYEMEARIQKWGNSDGIRIPSSILKSLNMKTNDILNIEQEDAKIITSIPKKRKYHWKIDLKSIMTLLNACIEE